MRVKAKLSRVSYDDRGKPIVNFLIDQCYNAFKGLNGNFTVNDKRGNPTKFTRDEFDRFFKIIEVSEGYAQYKTTVLNGDFTMKSKKQNIIE